MKNIFGIFSMVLCLSVLILIGCRKEELNPVPVWGNALQAWGRDPVENDFSGYLTPFKAADGTKSTTLRFQYNAVSPKIKCTKVELYVNYNEAYQDKDGLLATATHGGIWREKRGRLFKSYAGADLKPNRENFDVIIKPSEIYNLFKDATFDYGDGKGKVSVFSKKSRTPEKPFNTDDGFELMWVLYGDDGNVFDNWSNSICNGEVIASPANCFAYWLVE